MTKVFSFDHPIILESGAVLPGYHLTYSTHGQLNRDGSNVVWVFHALTANSEPYEWWPGLVGEGKLFDPFNYFIVCVNMPGSCYGSIGPLDKDPLLREPYYHNFPFFTIRDMIRAYRPLKEYLGIKKIAIGIGGSMGGQQLLEWAIEEPNLFQYIVPICTNAQHSPWGIAFNTAQRMAIEADPSWDERHERAGMAGMRAARATALLSYRHYDTYLKMQPRSTGFLAETDSGLAATSEGAASYQRYQGEKLARRFSPFSYYKLSQSMDSHDVSRGRGNLTKALTLVQARTLVIGIESDMLFPLQEQQLLASLIPGAFLRSITSLYGHDGFLLEYKQIEALVRDFLAHAEAGDLGNSNYQ
ncbi:MAG: homoserine O-acetyltransferase [Bacteroidetes bacterium]|nr:homoserine O-acetyltransferase [Bacteroidota bacterium]